MYVASTATVVSTAQVFGDARVSGSAQVFGSAWVFGSAQVFGSARVSGSAQVFGSARVSGSALLQGDAVVKSSADFIVIGPAISSGRYTTAHVDSVIAIRVNCGCFSGTVDEFSRQISKTHRGSNPAALAQYRAFVSLIKAHFKARDLL